MSSSRPRHGLLNHLTSALSALTQYVSARSQLLTVESKEAALQLAIAVGLALGGLFVICVGHVFLIIALVFAVASAFESDTAWIWIAFATAILHFASAIALGYLAYLRISGPWFTETLAELNKDSLWLHHLTKTP